jgi:glutathione reductase (NADPH)
MRHCGTAKIQLISNVIGCVPKKIMWYAADMADNLRKAAAYGFGPEAEEQALPKFNWTTLKHKRDAYIKRLNGI